MSELLDETTELTQQLIRNACVNDGSPTSGNEMKSAGMLAEARRQVNGRVDLVEASADVVVIGRGCRQDCRGGAHQMSSPVRRETRVLAPVSSTR